MSENKIVEGIKLAVGTVAGIGISMLVSAFAGNIASNAGGNGVKKICMAIGGAVLGSMLGSQAERYIDDQVDGIARFVTDARSIVQAAQKGE